VDEADNYYARIMIYSLEDRSLTPLTGERVDSYSPAWSPDGNWLYFLSDRYFVSLVRSPWGPRQPEPYFDRTTKVYHAALQSGLRSPFRPPDELTAEQDAENETGVDAEVRVEIDFDSIRGRTYEVPVPAGNYRSLAVNRNHLFWLDRHSGEKPTRDLVALRITNRDPEPKTVVSEIEGFSLSLDGEKILVRKEGALYVIEASGSEPEDLDEHRVGLSDWSFPVTPRKEWRQMVVEAWRLQRDYFYDPGLHGVDWKAQLERHLPLADRISERSELNDLLSQMNGELSALHFYIWGGDLRQGDDDVSPASLGAVLARDEDAGGYRVDHIYRSDPDYPDRLSPLARPGTEVEEGDLITSINGGAALSVPDPALLLRNQAGRQVLLGLVSGRDGRRREAIVTPITPSEARRLRYAEWIYTRRRKVEEEGDGRIGYVHLKSMGRNDISEWVKSFYPVFNRRGLIIDVRSNGGGNIDSWILEKLMRRAWMYWKPRVGQPYWNMQYAFRGHMVALCDEWTMSDGEAFIEGFRRLGLGKIIGTRTWGGEIWLSSSNFRLVDKGYATSASSGVYGPEGEWLIEGWGAEPDIVVDNPPHATFLGEDAQLDAAIAHLKRLIAEEPVEVPPPPPYPDKSGKNSR
jgi:tricorn protease